MRSGGGTGSSNKEVLPPGGSATLRVPFCGPGFGFSPFLNASITLTAVSGVKSS